MDQKVGREVVKRKEVRTLGLRMDEHNTAGLERCHSICGGFTLCHRDERACTSGVDGSFELLVAFKDVVQGSEGND